MKLFLGYMSAVVSTKDGISVAGISPVPNHAMGVKLLWDDVKEIKAYMENEDELVIRILAKDKGKIEPVEIDATPYHPIYPNGIPLPNLLKDLTTRSK